MMIYVKLEGHDWKYQVEDVLRLFFGGERATFTDITPPVDFRGIFIANTVQKLNNHYRITTVLTADGDIVNENYFDVPELVASTACCSLMRPGLVASPACCSPMHPMGIPKGNDPLREVKREVKRQIYLCLSEYLDRKLPWGTLTGIRPAKIVHEMINEGLQEQEILEELQDYYKVSSKKAALVYEVALNERPILEKGVDKTIGLYIGIPFCPSRCLYCSFTSNSIDKYSKMVGQYLDALQLEIRETALLLSSKGYRIQSVYIGGGTPTAIDEESLERLLAMVEQGFDLQHLEEFTLEAGRPDSLNEEKFRIIKNSRVDRISINPQTMNNETLKLIGRNHTAEEIVNAFRLARRTGFTNINMDLIVGLPGETAAMFQHTLEEIRKLDPDSLTVHSMAVKRSSRLHEGKESFTFTSADEASQMVDMALQCAKSMGMQPYYLYRQKNMMGDLENIGYCRPGSESIYNVQIMEEKQTIVALGAGAITKAVFPTENRIERAANVKNVEEYIRRVVEMVERKKALLL